jgi:hypothetical protein
MKIGDRIISEIGRRDFNTVEIHALLSRKNPIMLSWGAHNFVKNGSKWLRFEVNGHHFKGQIYIVLAFNDTFTLYYVDNNFQVVDIQKEVYIDMLIDTIDKKVEYVESYGNK